MFAVVLSVQVNFVACSVAGSVCNRILLVKAKTLDPGFRRDDGGNFYFHLYTLCPDDDF